MTARIFGIAGSTNSAEDFRLAAGGIFADATAINDRTGVTSVPTLTGTGSLTANVGPFSCLIDGTSNSLQGSYWVTLDAATGITITSGSAQARIDLISMQILDNAYDGSGFQKAQLVVTAGTPSGSPVAPATPANAIPLWTLPVPALASSVTFSTATAVFPYTAAVGGVVYVRSASDKPAVINGVQLRYRGDVAAGTGGTTPLETSLDGVTYTPVFDPNAGYGTWTNLTVGAPFGTSVQPQYRTAPGGKIELRGFIASNTTIPTSTQILSGLPAPSVTRIMPLPNHGQPAYLSISGGATAATVVTNTTIGSGVGFGFDGLSYTL